MMDAEVGDGDLGFNAKRAAQSVDSIIDYLDLENNL